MNRAALEASLRRLDERIAAGTRQAVELEKALGLVLSLHGDISSADEALRSTQHALGIFRKHREILLLKLASSTAL